MLAMLQSIFSGYTIQGFMTTVANVVNVEWLNHKGEDLLSFIEEQYRSDEDLKEFGST